ncbi:MAG: prepilin-type N-terminal cleavage/methylation domain-containing protein [Thermoleophilaceae bacterium]
MSRLTRDESGFTLIEILLVCVLMLIVMGATLTTFESFVSNSQVNADQNDAQQEARRSIDYLARELRNLASPVEGQPNSIKRAEAHDLIVQSVGATRPTGSANVRNIQYVRYCYNQSTSTVVRQRMTWTEAEAPPVPSGTACPDPEWPNTDFAANIVNGARPLFTYTWDGTDLTTVTEVHSSLWVDVNPGRRPVETTLSTTVFLRNQNREPTAKFSAAPTADGKILLNGSESTDPEVRSLRYFWYQGEGSDTDPNVGEGIVYEWDPLGFGNHRVYLKVLDPADLEGQADTQTVCVPGGGETCAAP